MTIDVKNVPEGSTEVPGSFGRVHLYDEAWREISSKPTNPNPVVFTDLIPGTYNYRVYIDSPTGLGSEFWGDGTATIGNAGLPPIVHIRSWPYIGPGGLQIVNAITGNRIGLGDEIWQGTPINISTYVSNPNSASARLCTVEAVFSHTEYSYQDAHESKSELIAIESLTGKTANSTIRLNEPGPYYLGARVKTYYEGTNSYLVTDTKSYTPALYFNVKPSNISKEWPMRGHDPQSTSSSTSSIAPLAINEKWAPFASPAGEKNFSDIPAATIWDHKVYINNNMDYRIYSIDSQTGNVLWINNINEGFSNYNSASPMKGNSQPAVSNGVFIVGSNSERESLVALDAFTGNQIWAYSYDEGIMSYDPVISSPRILNNRVYINSNGWVRCFDLFGNGDGTTSILWERQVHKTLAPYEKFRTSASTIAITEDGARLVVAYGGVDRISDNISGVPHHEDYESGGLICLNPENGSVIWNIEKMEGGNNNFSPVIYNNRVYYVDASSTIQGISLWSVDLYYEQTHNRFYISEVAGEPALYQDKIFVRKVGGFLSYDIDLKVYDLNGELLWTYDRPWQLVSADPICADNKVIFPISDILSTANTSIICIDAGGAGQDNDILWEYGFNDEVPTKVSIANEEIYVVTGVSEGMLSAAEKLYILKSSVDDAAPTLTLTVPNNGGTYSGSIQIVAVAEDNNAVSYVEFQYSVDHVNWQVLPVGSQDDPQNNARDWFSNDGWGFDFSSATSDPAVGFAGIINSPNVWVRARAVDTSGNSSNWDECDQPFAVTNIVPRRAQRHTRAPRGDQ